MTPKGLIRKWAKEQGYKLGDRGRIPAEIVEEYEKSRNAVETREPQERPEEITQRVKKGRKKDRKHMCGFCETNHHKLCPGSIKNGSNAPEPIWYCLCPDPSHT